MVGEVKGRKGSDKTPECKKADIESMPSEQ